MAHFCMKMDKKHSASEGFAPTPTPDPRLGWHSRAQRVRYGPPPRFDKSWIRRWVLSS